ncbi:MAG: hypothetical protein KDA37_18405 [Planctomycetales bacterium]|nr:hypothetical protein [Planctomycetales bacterium]
MEAKTRVRWQKLVDFFGMESLSGFRPWDAARADNLRGLSHREDLVVSFLLGVWDLRNRDWQHPRCDLFDAIDVWDSERTEAFLAWVRDPFWP